ncbi:DnaT-like ssDNA-binding protein [Enterobacter hormaechei]|uniref:DnaT-like ssDNA-binding protein n=1 Tax=Enterobacter hormaechei TaxID=158836 RepID=UPI0032187C23
MLVADPHSPGFNTYASVADLRAFAAGRGYTVPADDDECGMLLMQAMDFLEGKAWCGQRFSTSQPLSWPRSGVRFDGVDLPDDAIPQRLIDAQCRLAIESQEIDLTPSVSGGGAVIAESVQGAVSVQYEPGTNKATPSFPWFYSSLRGLVVGGNQVRVERG